MARKTPTRTCISCGKSSDKRELVRVVRTPAGEVALDASGKMPGRGAYLCEDEACWEKAAKGRLLDARLRTRVSPEDYEKLREEFRDLVQDGAQARSRDGE